MALAHFMNDFALTEMTGGNCHRLLALSSSPFLEPYPRRRRFVRSVREDDLSELEEERDLLERRLRRLERELEELRKERSEKRD